jgi:hypothetical protein
MNTLDGKELTDEYQHLSIDTKFLTRIKSQILSLFENLGDELERWLILQIITKYFRYRFQILVYPFIGS